MTDVEVADNTGSWILEHAFADHNWFVLRDAGWSDWDMEIHRHPWTSVRIRTVQEDHGSGRRLFRVRSTLRATPNLTIVGLLGALLPPPSPEVRTRRGGRRCRRGFGGRLPHCLAARGSIGFERDHGPRGERNGSHPGTPWAIHGSGGNGIIPG